jgi:hypothetical protein
MIDDLMDERPQFTVRGNVERVEARVIDYYRESHSLDVVFARGYKRLDAIVPLNENVDPARFAKGTLIEVDMANLASRTKINFQPCRAYLNGEIISDIVPRETYTPEKTIRFPSQ